MARLKATVRIAKRPYIGANAFGVPRQSWVDDVAHLGRRGRISEARMQLYWSLFTLTVDSMHIQRRPLARSR